MIQELPPIPDVPDRLIQSINERFRALKNLLTKIGSPGTFTKVTTDEQGRVTSGTILSVADLPGGGYPVASVNGLTGAVELSPHTEFYSARSSSIGLVTVASLPVGQYLVSVFLGGTTSGTGNVVWSFGWTSGGAFRTITTGAFSLNAGSVSSGYFATYPIHIDAGTNFSYDTTYTGSGAYEFALSLTKL